jgi:hypothetical protein
VPSKIHEYSNSSRGRLEAYPQKAQLGGGRHSSSSGFYHSTPHLHYDVAGMTQTIYNLLNSKEFLLEKYI